MPDPGILALMMVIVLLAFVAKGATGFGESLIVVPLFLLLLPLKVALPVALLVTATADVYMLWHHYRDIHRPGLAVVLGAAVAGVGLGTWLLSGLDARHIQVGFAIFVIAFALKLLFFDRPADRVRAPHPAFGGGAGLASGVIDALFGTGGPPLVIYYAWLGLSRTPFRATFVILAFSLHSTRIVAYSVAGLVSREILLMAALLAGPMVVGALAGRRLHDRLNDVIFRKVAAGILIVVGVRLLL